MHAQRRARRGSQAIEFALVLPVLLALTAGIVDYGWYYSSEMIVVQGVREGARSGAAAEDSACAVAEQATIDAIANTLPAIDADMVTVTVADDATLGGPVITVSVADLPFDELWGMVPTPTQMVASMSMRMEDETAAACAL